MSPVEPGTYRIISAGSGTCITATTWKDVVCWRRHDGKNQQWFVQRSGQGYRIKNCEYGHWLAISNTNLRAKVYGGRFPTTWELNQGDQDHNMYMIKYGDYNRIIDLDRWGAGHDGNEMHMYPQDRWVPHKRWRFERLGDDTGEDDYRLSQEVSLKNNQIAEKDQANKKKDQTISEKDELIKKKDQTIKEKNELIKENEQTIKENEDQTSDWEAKLAEKDNLLARITGQHFQQEQEIARLKIELADKTISLVQTQDALRRAENLQVLRHTERPHTQVQDRVSELDQQREETVHLRGKIEALEHLFTQMLNRENKRPNNIAEAVQREKGE